MARRRLLFVAHGFPPDSAAGVEVYTDRLARALRARGAEVAALTARVRRGRPQNAILDEVVDGLPVFGLVQNYPYRGLPEAVRDPGADRAVGRLLDRWKPDLLAVQTVAGMGVGVMHEAHRRGIPVVLHLHDAWWSCPAGGQRRRADGALCDPVDRRRCGACFAAWQHQEGPLERAGRWLAGRLPGPPDLLHRAWWALPEGARDRARRWNDRSGTTGAAAPTPDAGIEARAEAVAAALGTVAAVLSPTRFLAESLQADGVPLPSWTCVPTGVPEAPRRPPRDGPLAVRFLGTWVPHKGPQVFAEALAQLPPDLALQAEGVGPAPFPGFADAVVASAAGRLVRRPAVAPSAVPALLAQTDLLVVPSTWWENAPLVVLEARAAGVAVLATDGGGLPELVVDGVDGWLLPRGDIDAWTERLTAAAQDPAAVRALQPRPPRTVDDWADEIAARYEAAT